MDVARMASQSDPLLNPHFRRRWGPPPLKRNRPQPTGIGQGAEFEDCSSTAEDNHTLRLLQAAFRLDRLADAELALGRATAAERLAHEAHALREATR
jgi:hypothetical protein